MIEVRRIRATDTELESLICNLMSSDDVGDRFAGVRAFRVSEMSYVSVQPVKVRVTGQYGDEQSISLTLTPDLLIASFILFCTSAGIPMNRKSVKSVSRVTDGIAFDMIVRNLETHDTALAQQVRHAFRPSGRIDLAASTGQRLR